MIVNVDRRPGRLVIRADDPSLTPYAGLVISGELARNLRLVELLDAELAVAGRVAPVKQRRRGLSPGELTVAIAEAQLTGAECFDDIEGLRADRALAAWRAVAETPSASTARQLAYRFKPAHIRALERAQARCGNALDRRLGREATEDVTLDLDATETTVYGPRKRGTGRSRHGHLAYNSYVVTWAQRGRALTAELKGGNQAQIKACESDRMIARAERLLPDGHGQITLRGDSGFYSLELMMSLRKRGMRFTFSATRTSVMWAKLAEIPEDAWEEASDMRGAQVAELPFTPDGWKHEPLRLIVRRVPVTAAELLAGSPKARRRKTIPPEQLQMVLDGELDSTSRHPHPPISGPPADHIHHTPPSHTCPQRQSNLRDRHSALLTELGQRPRNGCPPPRTATPSATARSANACSHPARSPNSPPATDCCSRTPSGRCSRSRPGMRANRGRGLVRQRVPHLTCHKIPIHTRGVGLSVRANKPILSVRRAHSAGYRCAQVVALGLLQRLTNAALASVYASRSSRCLFASVRFSAASRSSTSAIMSITGLAARPRTAVEPKWWTSTPESSGATRLRSSSKAAGQAGS